MAMLALLLVSCGRSPNAALESDVVKMLAALKLPAKAEPIAFNTNILQELAPDVPGLSERLATISAGEKATVARSLADLEKNKPSPSGAISVSAKDTPRSLIAASTAHFDPLSWIVPPAQAQSLDTGAVLAGLSGMVGSLWLGGIAGEGNANGKVGHVSKTVEGPNGEKATITVDTRADGSVAASLASNVDVPVLGAFAGTKITFITNGLCPDRDGRVEFTIRMEQNGTGGEGSQAQNVEAQVTLTADDNAQISDRVIRTRYDRRASGKEGSGAASGTADWSIRGGGTPTLTGYSQTAASGASAGALQTSAATAAVALGIGAAEGAVHYWNGGNCIRIEAKTPYRPKPGQKSTIPVEVRHKRDGSAVPARVDVRLNGGESITPVVIRRAPGDLEHVAPDKRDAGIALTLSARSRRGSATETFAFTTYVEQAYRIQGGGGDPIDQIVCFSSAEKWVLNGKLFGIELSGGYDGEWKFVRTPSGPAKWKASGTYTTSFPDGKDKPGTMTVTGKASVIVPVGSRTDPVNEVLTMTPVDELCE